MIAKLSNWWCSTCVTWLATEDCIGRRCSTCNQPVTWESRYLVFEPQRVEKKAELTIVAGLPKVG